MYVVARNNLLGNGTEITVSVCKQRQCDALLVGPQASQDRKRQPSVAACSILEALYFKEILRDETKDNICIFHFDISEPNELLGHFKQISLLKTCSMEV